jgi:hypothetical protein
MGNHIMPSIIRATTTNGLQVAPDNSGSLQLQTNGTTTAVTIDTSQNVGIGVTPSAWSNVTAFQIESGSLCAGSIDTYLSSNAFYSTASPSGWKYISSANATQFYQNAAGGEFVWRTAASGTAGNAITFTEAMRIDSSGNLLIGTTSVSGTYTEKLAVMQSGNISAAYIKGNATTQDMIVSQVATDSGTRYHVAFRDGSSGTGSQRGSITSNGSSTAYNTTSDYRLKENVVPMTGALVTVSALKPVTYTWKENGSSSQGFIAHELAEVVPDAVTGEKDAVNEDGSIKPQSIDTSFLVATLTAAIQEQQTIINDLKARIEILEAK